VLANFHKGALEAHNRLDLLENWPVGMWDISIALGISHNAFWNKLNTVEFWTGLELTPDANIIVETLLKFFRAQDICIFTSPSLHWTSYAGKVEWIRKHFPEFDFLIGSNKSILASSDAYLIDDRPKTIVEFNKNGGNGILIPRIWNEAQPTRDMEEFITNSICQIRRAMGE
jgi:5'(3')-deoxyribonucleotidase